MEVEEIPDLECVSIRVALTFIQSSDSKPRASAFTNTPQEGDNLSSDWCRFASIDNSKSIVARQKKPDGTYKDSSNFKWWRFRVFDLRRINPHQRVEHQPIFNEPEIEGNPNNRAHAIIIGEKPINNAEFRLKLVSMGWWAE